MYEEDPEEQERQQRELQEMLGQTYALLSGAGEVEAALLVYAADGLRLEAVGTIDDGNFWAETVWGAVLDVEPALVPRFTPELRERIWTRLQYVLQRRGRRHVEGFAVAQTLPDVGPDWRDRALEEITADRVTNQARRQRLDRDYPTYDGMTFAGPEEVEVYKMIAGIQRTTPAERTFAVLPLPTAQLRLTGLRSPDLVVIGNGRALVIEIDGPNHRTTHGVVDDQERDRSWGRCGVETFRVPVEYLSEPGTLEAIIREEFGRRLYPPR